MNYRNFLSALLTFAASSIFGSEWTPLFNGKDLTGWTVSGEADAKIVDGAFSHSEIA